MTCVGSCDDISQVAVNDTMFGNMLVCRSFDYFVNVDSLSVVELGTADHPYKDLSSVFVELLNLHSHTDRTIRVYIKEGTQNYLYLKQNYITNITEVQFITFSPNSEIKDKAVIIGTDNSALTPVYGMPTKFNILKDRTLRKSEKIVSNPELFENEGLEVISEDCVIMQHRASLTVKNLSVTTSYKSERTTNRFFRLIRVEARIITIVGCNFEVTGMILLSHEPANFYFENLMLDLYRSNAGFIFDIY